ncbi:MAG: DUF3488 domain-containing protein [Deltaproteobacteria bacterium]|nr:DUF3488 domain-containing protein [Deltaproteobacteria bacterium]
MKFSSLHFGVTYLLAGLGFVALSLGSAMGPIQRLAMFLAFVATAFVTPRLMRDARWSQAWTVIVLAGLGVQIMRGISGEPILHLGIEYAALLQLSRLAYRPTAREYQQIAIISFLHLISATVLSSGLGYGLVFLGFVIVLPWMLALTHLRAEIERHYGDSTTGPSVARVLASKRVAGPAFLLGTASLTLPLFAITAIFFLAFPRVGMGFLSFGHGPGRQVAGFGRNVQLGGFGAIRDDPTVVLRVKVPGLPSPPPERLGLRMRGTSFDHYEDGEWTRSHGTTATIRERHGFFPLSRLPQSATERRLQIILDPLDEPVIFLPEGTIGISTPPRVLAGLSVMRDIVRSDGMDVRYTDADGLEFTYTAHVSTRAPSAPTDPIDSEAFARYLELPRGQERIVALARRWTAGAASPGARADLLLRHLRDSGDFRYTLEQPDTHGDDPLEVFLFEARAGHCEYYSTALAVMLRGLGVPARNVTGFLGGRYNRFGGYYAVRQGDAHSWVEAWIDEGWVTLDATPATRELLGPRDGMLGGLRALLDAMSMRWARHVVGYDLRRQAATLRELMGYFERWRRPGGSTAEHEEISPAAGTQRRSQRPSLAWLLLALPLLLAWWWRRRSSPPVSPDDARLRRTLRLYRRLDARLARRGLSRPRSRAPTRHLRALREADFEGLETAEEITALYLSVRYGGASAESQDLRRLERSVRDL